MLAITRLFVIIITPFILSSCAGFLYPDCRTSEKLTYAWVDSKKQVAPQEVIDQCTKIQSLQTAQQCKETYINENDNLCENVRFNKPIDYSRKGLRIITHVSIGLSMKSCMNQKGYEIEATGTRKYRYCTNMNGL